MNINSKVYVAGHNGLVGSALIRQLKKKGFKNIVFRDRLELDLRNQKDVANFFNLEKPEYVILAAAKVGGIYANNTFPAEFIHSNLAIQTNIIHQSFLFGIKKLLFLGSSCIYPRDCTQPIKEEYLLSGHLEVTNRPYAVAKIAGIEMCSSYNRQYNTKYLAVMPTNLFGVGDNYHPENSHVIPSLIHKFYTAKLNDIKTVTVWGTGNAKREFLFSDDLAEACIFLMTLEDKIFDQLIISKDGNFIAPLINIGSGVEISIAELSYIIKELVGYSGEIIFDTLKPDGPSRKYLDSTKINQLGWRYTTELEQGILKSIEDYRCKI